MKVYVGNIKYDTRDEDLKSTFEKFGEVESASVALDRETGKSKGFGFVVMPRDEQAQKAISMLNGTVLGGRTIRVGEYHPRKRDNRGNRSRGNGGGFRNHGSRGNDRRRPVEERW